MTERLSRREILSKSGLALGAGLWATLGPGTREASAGALPLQAAGGEIGVCLNTSTLRGHKLGLVAELELAAKTGYQGVELWVHELDEYEKSGGTLTDLGKRIRDLGLAIPDAIAFAEWLVDDPDRRKKGLEEARRRMEQLAKIGCTHIAAPPAGNPRGVDLLVAAERYRELLLLGDKTGVVPAVEVWGSAPVLRRLGEAAMVAMESGHPAACMVLDVFHLYKGGSGMDGVRHLNGRSIAIFHLNDYPDHPPREEIKDAERVFPGDGVAPLVKLVRDLRAIGYGGMLSLELFNPEYYRRDAAAVAREGLEKARAILKAGAA